MVSQPGMWSEEQVNCCKIQCFVRGVHAYEELWQPTTGQVLRWKREPGNNHNKCTVAVVKWNTTIVGHVCYSLAPVTSSFLLRDFNKGSVEITGNRSNHGAGYGLEAPCVFCLYGTKNYIEHLKEMASRLQDQSLVPESWLVLAHVYVFSIL